MAVSPVPQRPVLVIGYSRALNDLKEQVISVWRNIMGSKRFLITGATGTVGATGRKTAELLLERGHQVRAFVHQYDERSAQLEKQGVEIAGEICSISPLCGLLSKAFGEPTSCIPLLPDLSRQPPPSLKPPKRPGCQPS